MTYPVGRVLPGSNDLTIACNTANSGCNTSFAGHSSHHLDRDTLDLSGMPGEPKPTSFIGKLASGLFGFFGARYAAGKLGMKAGWKKTATSVGGALGASTLFNRFTSPSQAPPE